MAVVINPEPRLNKEPNTTQLEKEDMLMRDAREYMLALWAEETAIKVLFWRRSKVC